MVESSLDNPNSPAALLHKLCCRLLGKEADSKGTIWRFINIFDRSKGAQCDMMLISILMFPLAAAKSSEISEHFQYALRVVGR